MARMRRIKVAKAGAWYHLFASAGAARGVYPIAETTCQKELIRLMQHFSDLLLQDQRFLCDWEQLSHGGTGL